MSSPGCAAMARYRAGGEGDRGPSGYGATEHRVGGAGRSARGARPVIRGVPRQRPPGPRPPVPRRAPASRAGSRRWLVRRLGDRRRGRRGRRRRRARGRRRSRRRRSRRLGGLLRRRGPVLYVPPRVPVAVSVPGRCRNRRRYGHRRGSGRRCGDRRRLDDMAVAVAVAVAVPVPMAERVSVAMPVAVLLADGRGHGDEYRRHEGEHGNGSQPGPVRDTAHVSAIGIRGAADQQPCRCRYERPSALKSSLFQRRAGPHALGRRRRACGRGCEHGSGPCSPPVRGPTRSACNACLRPGRGAPSAASA
jgi:hypothetical protein